LSRPTGLICNRVGNLNGQRAAYIIDQLNRFAARHREDLVIDRIAILLRDADKKAVAEYLSGLQ
jgi:cytochrome c553